MILLDKRLDPFPVPDTTALIHDPADATKRLRIDCGAVATMTTRVLTMPDQDVDLTPDSGTFPAATHASRHQHGGADEIATATAGANAIPKAGAGGTLATAWLPGALPSLSAFNSNGFLVQTGANTFVARTLTGGTGVTVTEGAGGASNPSIAIGQSVAITATPEFLRIGIGVPSLTQRAFQTGGTLNGSTGLIGYCWVGTYGSDGTASGDAFFSFPTVQNASFTMTNLYHFRAVNMSKGASATVTNQTGVMIPDLSGATNNFGVQCAVSAGSNKWGWYGSGTANNLFNGAILMGQLASEPTPGSNQAGIYTYDNAGTAEVKVVDEAANRTQISYHPGEIMLAHAALMNSVGLTPVRVPWGMDSTNDILGIRTTADVAAAIRCVEWLMSQAGKPITLITETDIPRGPSWSDRQLTAAGDHQTLVEDFDGQVDAWREAVAIEDAKPFWAREYVPFEGRHPGTFTQKPEPAWLAAARSI